MCILPVCDMATETTSPVLTLPPEAPPTPEDVGIEQEILFNAPWDLEPVPVAEGMSDDFLLQLGAVLFRRGDAVRAERAWAAIGAGYRFAEATKGLRALALARQGMLSEARALAPEGKHLHGELLCALGRFDEGLAVMAKAREGVELVEWRALREALWLRRAGRPGEAAARIEARLERVARGEHRFRVEAIRAWLAAGEPERARPHLDALVSAAPGLARALRGAALDGLDWLPHGLVDVARAAADRGVAIHFVDRETSLELAKSIETGPTAPMGVLPGPAMWPALADGKAYVVVAQSMLRASRMAYETGVACWLAHPDRPGKLYLCLDGKIPAFLWPEVDADPDAIARTVAHYRDQLAVDEPRLHDLPRRLRLFIGASAVPSPYTGELEEMDFHAFGRIAVSSPFLESYGWGSEHAEDPHCLFVDRGALDGVAALRRTSGQSPQRPLSESYRTQHSRSIFSLEQHRVGFVVDVRYRPSPHPDRTRALNARFGTRYPEDLPLDCVGLLMHFHHAMTLDDLQASVVPGLAPEETWRLHAVGAMLHESIALDDWLRQLPDDLGERGDRVAWLFGRMAFLLTRAVAHPELCHPLQGGPYASGLRPDEEGADEEPEDEEGSAEEPDEEEP
jgi:hypothetical protein